MARTKKEDTGEITGRALVDIPRIGAKSGDYVTIPAELAAELETAGDFDPKAKPE